MIKVTNAQAAAFAAGCARLEDVVLDNGRGMVVARLAALVESKVQAFRFRLKALEKERNKIVEDHVKKDAKGERLFLNPEEADPAKKVLLFKNHEAASKALEAWAEKYDEVAKQMVEIEADPIADDFFTNPDEVKGCVQAVRTAFLPLMKAQQVVAEPKIKRVK